MWLILLLGINPAFSLDALSTSSPEFQKSQQIFAKLQKEKLNEQQKKIGTSVLFLSEQISPEAGGAVQASAVKYSNQFQKTDSSGRIQLYVEYTSNKEQLAQDIISLGGKVDLISEPMSLIQAWIPYDKVEELAKKSYVRNIRLPGYAIPQTGSVTSEGDTIHRSDTVRSDLGHTGAGIKVGVISTGIYGISASQASGDIPLSYEALSARSDGNLNIFNGVYDAEGLAMMEIVHDLAPGASLAFSNCNTSAEMRNAIQILDETYNCNIIVDDLAFFDEPMFEDGSLNNKKDSIFNKGKLYFNAAGNFADNEYYEGVFSGTIHSIGGYSSTVHNFGSGDWNNRIWIPAYSSVTVFLQWNDQFGASGNDYDLYLTDSSGSYKYSSSVNIQNGIDDPTEMISYTNYGAGGYAYLVVKKYSGNDKQLKLFISGTDFDEYSSAAGSVFGSQAAKNAIAVGAIDHSFPTAIENYSSQGPVRIDFPSYELRQKPDICGIDNITVTGNGGFVSPFPGTSAAAPHVAALAALIWSSNTSLTNTQVKNLLLNNAVDLGSSGYDNVYGYGRADVYASMGGGSSLSVSLFAPATGSDIYRNGNSIISYSASGGTVGLAANPISLYYSVDDGANYSSIAASQSNTGSYTWTVPDLAENSCKIKITAVDLVGTLATAESGSISVLSDSTSPTTSITSTLGGKVFFKGSTAAISYSASDSEAGLATAPITLYYSTDNGVTYTLIASDLSNSGSYSWTVPEVNSSKCKIKLCAEDLAGNISEAESEAFSITSQTSAIFVYPLPYRSSSGTGINFIGLSGDEVIRIYTLLGEQVRSLTNPSSSQQLNWDCKNDGGSLCVEGVYFYLIKGTSYKKTGKFIIIQ
ncbi:S8 family serine peptidase [Candidatus Margulisiibacteriota bacterium]